MNDEQLKALRRPFDPGEIDRLPKPYKKDSEKGRCPECGGWHGLPAVHLDYVGHAALTARLLDVDPEWTWEPVAFDQRGLPAIDQNGGLWIRLTVAGVTRLGYGHADGKGGGDAIKEAIGDALRNAAMRFGAALDLWRKHDSRAAAGLREGDERTAKPSRQQTRIRRAEHEAPQKAPASAQRESAPTQETGELADPRLVQRLNMALVDYGLRDRADKLTYLSGMVGREIESSKDLTRAEALDIDKTVRMQLAEDRRQAAQERKQAANE